MAHVCPADRFIVYHNDAGPVYSSDTISGVVSYLWGRDVSKHVVLVYEVPVETESADLGALDRKLYATVLRLSYPHGVDTPLY
jgi:hypothetical protein